MSVPAGVSRNIPVPGASHCAPSGAALPSVASRASPWTSCCALGIRLASRFSVPHSADDICAPAGRADSSGKTSGEDAGQQRPGQFRKGLTTRHDCGTLPASWARSRRVGVKLCDPPSRHAPVRRPAPHRPDGPGQRVLRRRGVRVRQDPPDPPPAARQARGTPAPGCCSASRSSSAAYLSASQLGITVASLSLGWLGEPAVARLLRPVLSRDRRRRPTSPCTRWPPRSA